MAKVILTGLTEKQAIAFSEWFNWFEGEEHMKKSFKNTKTPSFSPSVITHQPNGDVIMSCQSDMEEQSC